MKNCIRLLLFILLSLCLASNAFSQGFNADAILYSEAGLEKDPSCLEDRPYDGTESSDQPGRKPVLEGIQGRLDATALFCI